MTFCGSLFHKHSTWSFQIIFCVFLSSSLTCIVASKYDSPPKTYWNLKSSVFTGIYSGRSRLITSRVLSSSLTYAVISLKRKKTTVFFASLHLFLFTFSLQHNHDLSSILLGDYVTTATKRDMLHGIPGKSDETTANLCSSDAELSFMHLSCASSKLFSLPPLSRLYLIFSNPYAMNLLYLTDAASSFLVVHECATLPYITSSWFFLYLPCFLPYQLFVSIFTFSTFHWLAILSNCNSLSA